eukprot:TRINITY_DN14957_c0_g1_i2.p1 TRINITY_DN14957_c0_g1~~TRINITY_DN14957_c0_g1_i2.p1  ORF type:complete len:537 (+),score=88.14 TRINITY_DN14957_c0_g1_i2:203-1813(+)
MIIQLLADAGILNGGKAKIVVSVDPTKPLAQAIPNILSKLKLTKKESFLLYFTTHSTSLEHGLGGGEWYDCYSEATSSTGGLTISSDGLAKHYGVPVCNFAKPKKANKIIALPIAVDWNKAPSQLGLRSAGCYLWIKRTTKEPEPVEPVSSESDIEEANRLLGELVRYDPMRPFTYLRPAVNNGVPCAFYANKDISPGQVLWREVLTVSDAYPISLVETVASNLMLSLNLPFDKNFREASLSEKYSDEQWSKALSQATMNGTAVADDIGFAPWLSIFTRGCWPNATSFLSPDKKSVAVVSIGWIREGEEVILPWECIVNQFWLPTDRRNEFVERKYFKRCRCGRCLSPSEEDRSLTGAYYDASGRKVSNSLAIKVMREEYCVAVESGDRQQLQTFLQKYSRSPNNPSPLQLHRNHWRLGSIRSKLLLWYRSNMRKRIDKRLPTLLLDQLEMESVILPSFYPPRLTHYRQWLDLLQYQSQHVVVLLKRMAKEYPRINWCTLTQLAALEEHWQQTVRLSDIPPIPDMVPPPEDGENCV